MRKLVLGQAQLRIGDAGKNGSCIHVDKVVLPHQTFDLPEGHPSVGGQKRDLLVDPNDDISISFLVKSGRLLGLDLIDDNLISSSVDKVVQIRRLLPAVLLREIALCRLDCRGKLNLVYVSRLDLCLHQKMHDPVDLLADDPEVPDLRLKNDRL